MSSPEVECGARLDAINMQKTMDTLIHDVDAMLADRGSRYGRFIGHASITQSLKERMRDTPRWNDLKDDQKEALEMVAHKIGRILNGDPNYLDSWDDVIGYIKLVTDRIRENGSKPF